MTDSKILDRVRKLLAKAEAEGCTPEEAEALTAKAAELMAKYGIEQALLDATKPEADNKPTDRKFNIPNSVRDGQEQPAVRHRQGDGLQRCPSHQPQRRRRRASHVRLPLRRRARRDSCTPVCCCRWPAPWCTWRSPQRYRRDYAGRSHVKAYRRSWMLGFVSAVIRRVEAAENRAKWEAEQDETTGNSTALVLADRSLQVKAAMSAAYPSTRTTSMSHSGRGYNAGYASGQSANIGGTGSAAGRQEPR